MLRARYRDSEPQLLEPGSVYRLEIDLWAPPTASRPAISSTDFPKFDRNTNRGGEHGDPIPAHHAIYHDPEHPSHLLVSVLDNSV